MKLLAIITFSMLTCFGFYEPKENKTIRLKDAVAQNLVQTTIEYAQNYLNPPTQNIKIWWQLMRPFLF